MSSKKEQAWVGLFVLVASALLIATVFALSGAFDRGGISYRTYFKDVAGLEAGATVRVGGMKAGRIEQLNIDPQDPTRIEVLFKVNPGAQVKTDSLAKITSLGALGENYLEITLGSADSPAAPDGAIIPSREFFGIAQLSETLSAMDPKVQQLLAGLNDRVAELRETIARVNDLINDQNRANISASLGNVRGMLEENRPKIRQTLANIETASAKIDPLLDDFGKTVKQADEALARIDSMLAENREDIRGAIADLRRALTSTNNLIQQVDRTFLYNAENIDEILENIRLATENLKQFTDTIRARPASLIRSSGPPDRKPGDPPPPKP